MVALAIRGLIYLSFTALITAAVIVTLTRYWWLPSIAQFHELFEARIGALIGERVHIEKLAGSLRGTTPGLTLSGLTILDARGTATIRFETVRLGLDPFASLVAGSPVFTRVSIVGPKLTLRRVADGSVAVVGLTVADALPPWIWTAGRLDVLAAELTWHDIGSHLEPVALGRLDLHLENTPDRHRLSLELPRAGSLGDRVELSLDATGKSSAPEDWQGTLYVHGQDLDVARLSPILPDMTVKPTGGRLDAQVWIRWNGGFQSAIGEMNVKNPQLGFPDNGGTDPRLALKSLRSDFLVTPVIDGWQLDVARFQPILDEPGPPTDLTARIRFRTDGSISEIAGMAIDLSLGGLVRALAVFPQVDRPILRAMNATGLQGNAHDLRFYWESQANAGAGLALCGEFQGVTVSHWATIPGIAGANGSLCGTGAAGSGELSVANGTIDLEPLGLPRPIPLTDLRLTFGWHRNPAGWTVTLPALSGWNPELAWRGHARVELPTTAGLSPELDLQAQLTNVRVASIHHYLPTAILPETSAWAKRALLDGILPRANVVFRGRFADFPFDRQQGVLQADLEAENLTLRYHPGWVPVTGGKAHIEFRNATATVDARDGRIGAGHIVRAHGTLTELTGTPELALDGMVEARVEDAMGFLAESPLKNVPKRIGKFMQVSGNTQIAVRLGGSLSSQTKPLKIEGLAKLQDASIAIGPSSPAMRGLEGPLRFNSAGIASDGLRGRLLGSPAVIKLTQGQRAITAELRGRADAAALAQAFPSACWRSAKGAADYRLKVMVPKAYSAADPPLKLSLASEMDGLSIDLPAPFGKPETAVRPLRIEAELSATGRIPVELSYGSDIKSRLLLKPSDEGQTVESAELAVRQPLAADPFGTGLALTLDLDYLDLAEWRRGLGVLPAQGGRLGPVQKLHLKVNDLILAGAHVGPVTVDLIRNHGEISGRVDSDVVSGRIASGDETLSLDLDRVSLARLTEAAARPQDSLTSPGTVEPLSIDPTSIPSMKIRARSVRWQGADLGSLALDSERRAHGMIVKSLAINGENHTLALRGNWTRNPSRPYSTRIDGKVHIDSLGDLLEKLGGGGNIRDTTADLRFGLHWDGGPLNATPGKLGGELTVALGEGSLLDMEPGVGRVIGMLNLGTIWRRLNLDFSDLYGQGLAYDSISGTFRIEGGQAITDAFLIDGVASKILVSGRVGLVERNLDETVTVIPHTTAALPIAGALAGGPAVGAAVLVAQQLIGEEVDSITATQYSMRGSWKTPTITRINHNMPLDMLDSAWNGIRSWSGFGQKPEADRP